MVAGGFLETSYTTLETTAISLMMRFDTRRGSILKDQILERTVSSARRTSRHSNHCSQVDKLSVSYAVLWNALKKIGSRFSDDEKEMLFHGTAERIYRLVPVIEAHDFGKGSSGYRPKITHRVANWNKAQRSKRLR